MWTISLLIIWSFPWFWPCFGLIVGFFLFIVNFVWYERFVDLIVPDDEKKQTGGQNMMLCRRNCNFQLWNVSECCVFDLLALQVHIPFVLFLIIFDINLWDSWFWILCCCDDVALLCLDIWNKPWYYIGSGFSACI